MFKATTSIIENDKYEVESVNAHYLKRVQKDNNVERYFCIAQSKPLSLEALAAYVKDSKEVMSQLGKENVRATLVDTGYNVYQATIVYFDNSLSGLKAATKNLNLLNSTKAIDFILNKD